MGYQADAEGLEIPRAIRGISRVFRCVLGNSGNFRESEWRLRWSPDGSGGSQEESENSQESCWEISGGF